MRHGTGSMKWPDGASYIGEWSYNEASKDGKFVFPNGDVYEGSWAMNLMCGYGVLKHSNGTLYRWQSFDRLA